MKSTNLYVPLSMGNLHLKNRIALAPMTRGRAGAQRVPNDFMGDYYLQRSGAGLLITEATVISSQGIGWIDSPGIYTQDMVEGWQKVTQKISPTQTPFFCNCGTVAGPPIVIITTVSCRFQHPRSS